MSCTERVSRSPSDSEVHSDEPCSFSTYQCSLPRLENYVYCIRHILEDKGAPFRQCNYTYSKSSKRCYRAAPISDKDGYCIDHSRVITRKRQKSTLKPKPLETPESCLERLSSHHVIPVSSLYSVPDAASVPSTAATALQYGSEDENDSNIMENLSVQQLPLLEEGFELDCVSSDNDLLDNAEVFTEEEVLQIYTSKLQKLRDLYSGEYSKLMDMLKNAKKECKDALKTEKETMGSVHSQPKETAEDEENYRELKALARYHRNLGREGLLHWQLMEKKRMINEGSEYKPSLGYMCVKCVYNEGSWRCGEKSIPLSKYCFKHIMQDKGQILFKECGSAPGGNEKCQVPVLPTPISNACIYHTTVPSLLPVSNPTSVEELSQLPVGISPPHIIDLSDSSAFIVSELPPDNVMEGDAFEQSDKEEQINVV